MLGSDPSLSWPAQSATNLYFWLLEGFQTEKKTFIISGFLFYLWTKGRYNVTHTGQTVRHGEDVLDALHDVLCGGQATFLLTVLLSSYKENKQVQTSVIQLIRS